jgi:poly-gamma-glutamate capsule biosynthesis protein CapA/YwtB (metallophosphatase superfamily)
VTSRDGRPRVASLAVPGSRSAALAAAALLSLAVVASACGSGGASTASTDTDIDAGIDASTDTDDPSSTSTTADPGPDPVLGSGNAVTFAFGGDVHFERELGVLLARDPASPLSTQRDVLSAADLAMVNLETAVTTRGTAAAKEYTFRAPPAAFDALRAAGVDVTTVANNHGLDYGAVGMADTLAAARAASFPMVGMGNDQDEAFAPWTTEIKGQRISVIGATQVLDSNLITAWTATATQGGLASAKLVDRITAEVRQARAVSDTVVVFLHWGTERSQCPNPQQQQLAVALQQAGADIIVGSHAHVLLAGGRLGNAFVAYGLGNYFFYATTGNRADTGVVKVTATGRRIDGYEFLPARISGGQARSLSGAAADSAVASWNALRSCTDLTP